MRDSAADEAWAQRGGSQRNATGAEAGRRSMAAGGDGDRSVAEWRTAGSGREGGSRLGHGAGARARARSVRAISSLGSMRPISSTRLLSGRCRRSSLGWLVQGR